MSIESSLELSETSQSSQFDAWKGDAISIVGVGAPLDDALLDGEDWRALGSVQKECRLDCCDFMLERFELGRDVTGACCCW